MPVGSIFDPMGLLVEEALGDDLYTAVYKVSLLARFVDPIGSFVEEARTTCTPQFTRYASWLDI